MSDIQVRGTKEVSQSLVIDAMRSKVGQPYSANQLTKDRELIMLLNLFQDAKLYGQYLEDKTWRIVVEVVEWPKVREIKVSGNTLVPTAKILESIKTKPGEIFNPGNLLPDARSIEELYRTKGFFARVIRYEPSEADSSLVLIEMVEVKVKDVTLTGLTRTSQKTVKKMFDTGPNDFFNSNIWRDDLRRVVDSRWFEEIKPDLSEPELGTVDLKLDLKETRTGAFNVGMQMDPRNRLAGFVSLNDNNFNGTGKTVGGTLVQSAQGLGTSLTLEYGDPFIDSKRSSLSISAYSRESLLFGRSVFGGGGGGVGQAEFSQRKTGGIASLSRVLGRDLRGSAGLRVEAVNSNNFTVTPGEEFVVQDGVIAGVEFGLSRNRRDNSVEPAKGDWLKLSAVPSYSNISRVGGYDNGFDILGDNFYAKLNFDYRAYFSRGPMRKPEEFDKPVTVVALRASGGYILGDVPFFEQYFVGGANGVRGYAEDRFWGKQNLLFQAELRYPIQKAFSAVVFADFGGAWGGYGALKNFTQERDINMKLGYGVGITFKTALGPIRLDLGFDDQGKPRTHFTIGTSF
ncbi:MAG: BamA/TamA family outer membrane protein [Fimbriimonadales bacterium]